jgi:ribonucleoside-diphosphate reductase alpha chain
MTVAVAQKTTDYRTNAPLKKAVKAALERQVPMNYIVRALSLVDQGYESIDFPTYTTHFEGEAYNTVSGQNSNNSVRVTNEYMEAVGEPSSEVAV